MATPGPIDEGSPVFLTGKFTGGAGHGPYSVDVDWGDGTSESYSFATADPCALPAVCVTVQKANPYVHSGDYTVVVFLNDPTSTNFKNLPLSVGNSAPSFTSFALSASEIEVGQSVTATGHFTDASTNDTHTVKVDWNDGSPLDTFVLAPGARDFTTGAHTYLVIRTYTVSVIVTDSTGLWTPATATLSVHEATQPNQAPTVAFEFTAGPEGGNSTLAVTFADADAADTHTVSVAWGDGQTTSSGTLAATETTFGASHVYADTGNYSLAVTVTDSGTPALSATATQSVSPTNVDPVVGALTLSPNPVVDHQTLTVSGSFTDPGTTETFTLNVAWGDGTPSTDVSLGTAKSFSATHAYSAAGPATITATVTDANGGHGSATANLVVGSSNHAPSNLTLDVSGTGANVVVNANFDDPDAGDSHTVVLTWGDGDSVRPVVAAGTTTFTASHVYEASGTYTLSATVTDAAGAPTSATTQVTVTVSAGSAADVLDEMADLVRTFGLDRNTERWLLKKIDDLKASLAYGNGQVCAANGLLEHVLAFALRTTDDERFVELKALSDKLNVAAGCSSTGAQSPKVQRAATATAKPVPPTKKETPVTSAPTPNKPTANTSAGTPNSAPTPSKDVPARPAKADLKATGGRNSH